MVVAWGLLIIAGVIEAFWPIAFKASDGFTKLQPTLLSVVLIAMSVSALIFAMKDIPAATAYIVFVGIGAVGVLITAYLFYNEPITLTKCLFAGLIVIGICGLKITSA